MSMSTPSARRLRRMPEVEGLERRDCPTIALAFDYRYDSAGFFNDPARRAALERAGQTYSSLLNDRLAAITPSGSNSWSIAFENPATGATATLNNQPIAADTLWIFAGARPLTGSILAEAGPGDTSVNGSAAWRNLVLGRGKAGALGGQPTAFAPWGGSVTFNTSVNWFLNADATGLGSSQSDFTSVALHEIGHILGIGASPVWNRLSVGGLFQGTNVRQYFDGPGSYPAIDPSGHWGASVVDDGQSALMTPYIPRGTRKLATRLDMAGLQDLGWQVAIDVNGTIAGAIAATPGSSGSLTLTAQSLTTQTDVNLYRVDMASAGAITITTQAQGGSASVDTGIRLFDATGKEIGRANSAGGYESTSIGVGAAGSYYVGIASAVNQAYSAVENPARLLAGGTGSYQLVINTGTSGGGGGGGGSPYIPPQPPPSWQPNDPGTVVTPPAIPGSPPDDTPTNPVPIPPPTLYVAKVRNVTRQGNRLTIAFNKTLVAAGAQNRAAYTILLGQKTGRSVAFGKPVAIASARYDARSNTVTLLLKGKVSGPLQLTIHGDANLRDKAGNLLDGNNDGKPGGDYVRTLK
ncbi:MAG: hypothetical protein U0800_11135 [Isosphaeraceae bacterium]